MNRRILGGLLLAVVCGGVGAAEPPPLMLAKSYTADIDPRDWWVSEKLDGVRAYWDGERLISRGGHPIHAPAWFTAGWPAQPLDGELWSGRSRFEDLSATVRDAVPDDAAWRAVRYRVFDLPAHPGVFDERLAQLKRVVAAAGSTSLHAIEQLRIDSRAALDARLAEVVAAGGEGLMLHRADSHYRARRTDDLLKLKPYDDAEARVVAYQPGAGKYAGQVGALVVERADGLRFELGSGLTDAQRREPPPLGSWVTYRYNGSTEAGVPRFARFLRIRDELPPPDPP